MRSVASSKLLIETAPSGSAESETANIRQSANVFRFIVHLP